jgi:hypothetical protein
MEITTPPIPTQSTQPLWTPGTNDLAVIRLLPYQVSSLQTTQKQLINYHLHPQHTVRIKWGLGLFGIACLVGVIYFHFAPQALIGGFIPYLAYVAVVSSIAQQEAYAVLAQNRGWFYVPEDVEIAGSIASSYPSVFDVGGDRNFDNCVRGTMALPKSTDQALYFWLANFSFRIGSGKNSTPYSKGVYAFRLPRPVVTNFCIINPGNVTANLSGMSQDITTEVGDFNKMYKIHYNGERQELGRDIFQVLAPDVQEKLLAFKSAEIEQVAFYGSTILFVTDDSLPAPSHADKFLANPDFENAQVTEVEQNMLRFLDLAVAVAAKL